MSTSREMGLLSNSMVTLSGGTLLWTSRRISCQNYQSCFPAALPPFARLALTGGVALQFPGASWYMYLVACSCTPCLGDLHVHVHVSCHTDSILLAYTHTGGLGGQVCHTSDNLIGGLSLMPGDWLTLSIPVKPLEVSLGDDGFKSSLTSLAAVSML